MTRPARGTPLLHATLLVGLSGCAVASWIEWHRALSGHLIAWAYAFEWPFFAVLGTWVWWRLLHGDDVGRRVRPPGEGAGRLGRRRARAAIAPDDPQLLAWQEYLTRLHAADPPGGPPA